jgi:threonine dehydrogenase-like Zn-dependent dehydrogenase
VPEGARALAVLAPGELDFVPVPLPAPEPGQFRVETILSGLSAGTELTYLKGTNPYLHSGWDAEQGVFRQDRPAQRYPVDRLGYMETARVVESRTDAVEEGAIVAMAYGHRTAYTADPAVDRFVVLPPGLDPVLGIYVAHMGPICANGLLHAAADLAGRDVRGLGDGIRGLNVLVTGAGVVGLLTGLFCRLHGAAEVAVADRSDRRLDAAAALGFLAIDERADEPWQLLKRRWRHGPADSGADVAFQCRGRTAALVEALRSLRPQGSVIDLAFYQGGAPELRLGEEFHHNGLSLRCAQIGRVPRGLGHVWSRRRLAGETLELLDAFGSEIRDVLVTDVVPFAEAPRLMAELAARERDPIQAVFAIAGQAGSASREALERSSTAS